MKMPSQPALAGLHFAGAGAATGPCRLLVRASSPFSGEQQKMLYTTVSTFGLAAARGAFGVSGSDPVRGTVASAHYNAGDAEFECDLHAIEPRSFQVLRQMLTGLQTEGLDIVSVNVMGLAQPPHAALPSTLTAFEDDEEAMYPGLVAGVPLLLPGDSDSFSVGSRLRRCEITLVESVASRHLDAMRDIADPWFTMLECGGYALPVEMPWVVNNVGGSINPFDTCSIELTVIRFDSSEQAWLALANMIHVAGPGLGLRALEIRVDD